MSLTKKQQVFLENYLTCWNATESARRAGYAFPNVEGPKNLVNPSIKAAIKERLEALTMSADEVLTTYTAQARGDMGEFVEFKDGVKAPYLNLKDAYDKGLLKLVKKLRYNSDGQIEFELYDAQAALKAIREMRGFDAPTKQQLTGAGGGDITIRVKYDDSHPDDTETT